MLTDNGILSLMQNEKIKKETTTKLKTASSQQATSEKRDKWENYKFNESESLDYFDCNLMRLSNQLAFCLLKNNVDCLFFEILFLYFIEWINISNDDNNRIGSMATLFVSQWVMLLHSIHNSCSVYSWTIFVENKLCDYTYKRSDKHSTGCTMHSLLLWISLNSIYEMYGRKEERELK